MIGQELKCNYNKKPVRVRNIQKYSVLHCYSRYSKMLLNAINCRGTPKTLTHVMYNLLTKLCRNFEEGEKQ
jgi:hypothetical protein